MSVLCLKLLRSLPALYTLIEDGPQNVDELMGVLRRRIVGNGYGVVHHFGPLEHAEYEDWTTEFQHEIIPASVSG